MAIPSLITEHYLAQLLQLNTETFRVWRLDGFFPETAHLNRVAHYSLEAITTLLQQGACNFTVPPTAEALLTKQLQLITLQKAQELLAIPYDTLLVRINTGRLAAIKLGHQWRISLASLQEYWQESNNADLIPRELAMHVLGAKSYALTNWIIDGELRTVEMRHNQHLRPITMQSLLHFLEKLLPSWINPSDWLRLCLLDKRPLLYLKQIIPYLGLDVKGQEAHALMQSRQLSYLQLPGGDFKILPYSADMVLLREGGVPIPNIANLFGVTMDVVQIWLSNGLLNCNIHGDHPCGLYRACLLGILRAHLSSGMKAREWYGFRITDPSVLLDVAQASMRLGVSQVQLLGLLESGIARGLRLPGTTKQWRITTTYIDKLKRQSGW
jgi:excisionase family DNA binding protein